MKYNVYVFKLMILEVYLRLGCQTTTHHTIPHTTTQHHTPHTTHHYTLQHNTQHYTSPHNTTQYYTLQHNTTHHTPPHTTTQHTTLHIATQYHTSKRVYKPLCSICMSMLYSNLHIVKNAIKCVFFALFSVYTCFLISDLFLR